MRTSCNKALFLAAGAAWLAGCGGPLSRGFIDPVLLGRAESPDEPAAVVPVDGPVGLDVESFNGDVVITADAALTHAVVRLRREALHGLGRGDDATRSLKAIECDVELAMTDVGPALRVRAQTTAPEPHFQRAHLTIVLPEVQGLRVRTSNGAVVAVDVAGEIDVETSRGPVRLITAEPLRGAVTIRNDGGDIDYRVRPGSTGALECRAEGGQVHQRVRGGRFVVHAGTRHDALAATLNGGTNPVRLHTTGGDVRVAVVDDPKASGPGYMAP